MASETDGITVAPQSFSNDDVLKASFRLETGKEGEEPAQNLFLRTYRLVNTETGTWHAMPEKDWPLIATILPKKIVMHPIHANPHAQRYLTPKNGQFTTIIYIDGHHYNLTNNLNEIISHIEINLDFDVFDFPSYGLGLNKNLDPLWRELSKVPNKKVLVISRNPKNYIEDDSISLHINEVDKLRRSFNRATRNGREQIHLAKRACVYNDLLTKLYPERFPRIIAVTPKLVQIKTESATQTATRERAERRSNVQAVQKQLDTLVTEAPQALMELHAEIERVTLAKMIEEFKAHLDSKQKEPRWQEFFGKHEFVLSIAFARPVKLVRTQFHAKGSTLNGTGAQIGDFLLKEHGQALAIVEIKTPETDLVQGSAYRGQEVFGPASELSGAITQVLFQQSETRQRWFTHKNDTPALDKSGADVIKCVIVAGRTPTDPIKLRSFEVFRNACKDVDIITFDELLAKLEFLKTKLTKTPEDLF